MNQAPHNPAIPRQPDGVCTPRCPNELIKHILSHCRQDKHTLSVCMRVSPTFNALAAPLLYHNVKLDFAAIQKNELQNPFHVPSALIPTTDESLPTESPEESIPLKMTGRVTKQQCLAYVRHVSVEQHNSKHCYDALDSLHHSGWARHLAVDTVRSELSAYNDNPPGLDDHWLGREQCRVEQLFNPRRFVFEDICPFYANSSIPVDTTVSIFRQVMDVDESEPSVIDSPSKRNFATRAVYIFLPQGDLYYDAEDLDECGYPSLYTIADRDYRDFQTRLELDAWESEVTEEVVVVNIDSVNKAYKGPDRVDLAADLQSSVDQSDERPKGTSDTPFTVKFITMKEFLQQYDWTGVIKEDEVGQWLD